MSRPKARVESIPEQQIRWAMAAGVPVDALEVRRDSVSHVLTREYRKLNLFKPEWWDHIAGREHRWARALNSSQCFGVNLFAPLIDDAERTRSVLIQLLPSRPDIADAGVCVRFEYTPVNAPSWLGERGQPTQVDVYFRLSRGEVPLGHVLVEVKFTERSFGGCRGWNNGRDTGPNPDSSRCLDAAAIVLAPEERCWLTKTEGRQYWRLMANDTSSIKLRRVREESACPFRTGLYQLMRNRMLADELRRQDGGWAELAVCRHPENTQLLLLTEPVAGSSDALAGFRALSSPAAVHDWPADELVELIASIDGRLDAWRDWMRLRYFSK